MKIQMAYQHLGGIWLFWQIKTLLRFCFTPVRKAAIHKKWQSWRRQKNACEEIHKGESLYTSGGCVNLPSLCGSQCGAFIKQKQTNSKYRLCGFTQLCPSWPFTWMLQVKLPQRYFQVNDPDSTIWNCRII